MQNQILNQEIDYNQDLILGLNGNVTKRNVRRGSRHSCIFPAHFQFITSWTSLTRNKFIVRKTVKRML